MRLDLAQMITISFLLSKTIKNCQYAYTQQLVTFVIMRAVLRLGRKSDNKKY